jgi:pyruvate/2-oxoglutarate dehydrogenase complex dihydrolipoamide dehydrogenase (E3) component
MQTAESYDAIIVGAGQSGMPLASAFAGNSLRTALIERRYVGGTCINDGCTPTKSMLASARVAHVCRQSADFGVHHGQISVNLHEVRQRKQSIVEDFRQGDRKKFEQDANIDLIEGEATFNGPATLQVDVADGSKRIITAKTIVLDLGTRPRLPEIEGLDSIEALTSTTIMELDALPDDLLILGGGYVGVEFAQMFARFGTSVSLIERSDQVLVQEDADIAAEIVNLLRAEGVDVLLQTHAVAARPSASGGIELEVHGPTGTRTLHAAKLLLATGRVPNTDAINAPAGGIELDDKGYIKTDDQLKTSASGVYATGDVKGGPAFTHISYDDYRVLAANLLEGADRSIADRLVSYTVYTDPQLGRVGLNEKQARQQDRGVRVAQMPLSYVARAIEVGETRGLMKAVVDADSDQILGCSIFGLQGGELMSALQIAILGGVPFTVLRDAPFAHPTLAESFNNLFATVE